MILDDPIRDRLLFTHHVCERKRMRYARLDAQLSSEARPQGLPGKAVSVGNIIGYAPAELLAAAPFDRAAEMPCIDRFLETGRSAGKPERLVELTTDRAIHTDRRHGIHRVAERKAADDLRSKDRHMKSVLDRLRARDILLVIVEIGCNEARIALLGRHFIRTVVHAKGLGALQQCKMLETNPAFAERIEEILKHLGVAVDL